MHLQIKVFLSKDLMREGRYVFCRIVEHCESIDVPWTTLFLSLRFMFGSDSIITFEIF